MTHAEMLRFVRALGRVRFEEVEDVVSAVVVRLLEKHGTLDLPRTYVKKWLRGEAINRQRSQVAEYDALRRLAHLPEDQVNVEVCKNGHLRTPETTARDGLGYRECLICRRKRERRYYARRKALGVG